LPIGFGVVEVEGLPAGCTLAFAGEKEELLLGMTLLESTGFWLATIRQHNKSDCLPVFTIGSLDNFRLSRAYAERVLKRLYEHPLDIDNVRGTGRLFLP
jgi:hypothetical protein